MNDVKGIVQDLREFRYAMSHSESVISSTGCSSDVTEKLAPKSKVIEEREKHVEEG